MDPLPKGVELVAEPGPDVELLVLGHEFGSEVPALIKRLPGAFSTSVI